MFTLDDLEEIVVSFPNGYRTARNAFNKYESVNFEDKNIGFELGFGAYAFFHQVKAFRYKKVMREKLKHVN